MENVLGQVRRLLLPSLLVSLLVAALAAFGPPAAAQSPGDSYVELILDASGSMWNTLADGRYRIVAAKEVLGEFIDGLPESELNVGLRIYGSRVAARGSGACEDSDLFVPLDGLDKGALRAAVEGADALGATPIALSLQRAAQDFPAEAARRLIVLVTDGEESCGGDLEAAAAALRAQGVEIDLAIIGFDLDPDAAAGFEGLGRFVNATDARQLAAALRGAVEEVVAEPEPLGGASLDVPAEVPAGQPFEVDWQGPDGAGDYVTLVQADAPDGAYGSYRYTRDGNPLTLHAPIEAGAYEVRYQSDRVAGVAARTPVTVIAAEVALEAPLEIPAGQRFEVRWLGPDGDRDYVTIVPADAADGAYTSYAYTRDGNPLTLHAPIAPGSYELRYQSDREAGVFARRELTVVPVEIRLVAPESVPAAAPFQVEWVGPNGDRDYVTIVPADAADGVYASYAYTRDGTTLTLTAPVEAGSYEVRYQSDRESGVFARVPITVEAAQVTLDAPGEVSAGSRFEVAWQGPDGSSDYLTIVPAGAAEGAYLSYAYTRSGTPAVLTAPDAAGDYEIRYVSGQGDRTLTSAPIAVR